MAGCFGNHPVDRYLEGQLNEHLKGVADYENYCEQVANEFTEKDWEGDLEDKFSGTDYDIIIQQSYTAGETPKTCAEKILQIYEQKRIMIEITPQSLKIFNLIKESHDRRDIINYHSGIASGKTFSAKLYKKLNKGFVSIYPEQAPINGLYIIDGIPNKKESIIKIIKDCKDKNNGLVILSNTPIKIEGIKTYEIKIDGKSKE